MSAPAAMVLRALKVKPRVVIGGRPRMLRGVETVGRLVSGKGGMISPRTCVSSVFLLREIVRSTRHPPSGLGHLGDITSFNTASQIGAVTTNAKVGNTMTASVSAYMV